MKPLAVALLLRCGPLAAVDAALRPHIATEAHRITQSKTRSSRDQNGQCSQEFWISLTCSRKRDTPKITKMPIYTSTPHSRLGFGLPSPHPLHKSTFHSFKINGPTLL
jgi:hypothetical protein